MVCSLSLFLWIKLYVVKIEVKVTLPWLYNLFTLRKYIKISTEVLGQCSQLFFMFLVSKHLKAFY